MFRKWREKETIWNTKVERRTETYLGNENDESAGVCTEQSKEGEDLQSQKKTVSVPKKGGKDVMRQDGSTLLELALSYWGL